MAMDNSDLADVLNTFAQWPRSFSIEEILNFLEEPADEGTLHLQLLSDSRFICLSELPREYCYIPKATLLRWFSNLNIKLAQICKFRLDEHQLALTMSCLRRDGRWDVPPKQAVQLGQSLGLIGSAWTPGHYVFPLAWVLALSISSTIEAQSILENLVRKLELGFPLQQVQQEILETIRKHFLEKLSQCDDRQLYIMRLREGLETGVKMTLEEVTRFLNLTRERIRQIEKKFWDEVWGYVPKEPTLRQWFLGWLYDSPDFHGSYDSISILRLKLQKQPLHSFLEVFPQAFLGAILCQVMDKSGSLVIDADSSHIHLMEFLAEHARIPYVNLSDIGLMILASSPSDLTELKSSLDFPSMIDTHAIAAHLEFNSPVPFIASDVRKLADNMAQFNRKHLDGIQRVYLALRVLGRPAHYSEITEVHNSLFPDCYSTERNVHAVLSREQYGIVWIGVRGTFALKEWGYERPSKSLFEAVTEIVKKKFKETGKPVPFTVIAAEVGKYRKIVKPASLVFATHFNPNLRRVSKDFFIPKSPDDQIQEEISLEELDKILQEFQRQDN